jgi:hypothetical protein
MKKRVARALDIYRCGVFGFKGLYKNRLAGRVAFEMFAFDTPTGWRIGFFLGQCNRGPAN